MTYKEHLQKTLDTTFVSWDLGETTVRQYLRELLHSLFKQGDAFRGKRPWGNSGWIYDLAEGLHVSGLIQCTLDPEGRVDTFNEAQFYNAVHHLIEEL